MNNTAKSYILLRFQAGNMFITVLLSMHEIHRMHDILEDSDRYIDAQKLDCGKC